MATPTKHQARQDVRPDSTGPKSGTQGGGHPSQSRPEGTAKSTIPKAPSLSLPKGGGSIRGMGEKFDVNLGNGTATMSFPIHVSAARGDIHPDLSLSYDSGSGNGPFGLGWHLSTAHITRKTNKGLPRYNDGAAGADSDVFLMSDAEDLVPLFKRDNKGGVVPGTDGNPAFDEVVSNGYIVRRYSPRIEGSFIRIERWMNMSDGSDIYWRMISPQNRTTIFGSSDSSRIYDPNRGPGGPRRVFSWLIAESYDDRGNAMVFNYKAEDSVNVPTWQPNEANRTDITRSANRYLKSIQYGNRVPNRQSDTWSPISALDLPSDGWTFSVVFDYGEHDAHDPKPSDNGQWKCRPDPFSDYHSGFEVRTYRLCERILMFHHFAELKTNDCLVTSVDLTYNLDPTVTYLVSALQAGYVRDGSAAYIRKALPPLSFEYSTFPSDEELSQLVVQQVDKDSLENLPIGSDKTSYQWVDLDSEGLSGLLTDQGGSWFYKRNTSANNFPTSSDGSSNNESALARFSTLEIVPSRPSMSISSGQAHFGDVSGAGKLDVIEMERGSWGFYERNRDGGWIDFRPLSQFPNIDTKDSNVKFVDLTGDGVADILIYADRVYQWFPSLGLAGYGQGQAVTQPLNENLGPTPVVLDAEQTIYLADMSGDGLSDLVRVRNGDVCYWPNIGYGQFGALVRMANAPWFDSVDIFNEKRIHLADIDGSGTTDILYFSSAGLDMYLNQSGNGFSDRKHLSSLPPFDNLSAIDSIDLLGNGTTCIVWSSPLPGSQRAPMQYVDLMRGKKPHLLTKFVNNLGTETNIQYAQSTKFYLQDKQDRNPWITALPFPVHCVERLEIVDHISGNTVANRYSYHHGYFDDVEREFRGFARVEHWDTESFVSMSKAESTNVDSSWHTPPVHTKTWFHTGVYIDNDRFSRHLAQEYFGAAGNVGDLSVGKFEGSLLGDTVLPSMPLGTSEVREACRALKGHILRVEVYSEDGSAKAGIPYSIEESNYTIEVLQPIQDTHSHSVFMVHARESISYYLERSVDDPRIKHALTLEVDRFGNVLKSLQVAYGRQPGMSTLIGRDREKQQTPLITYHETDFTNEVNTTNSYRVPIVFESRQYQLSGLKVPSGAAHFSLTDFTDNGFAVIRALTEVPYEQGSDPNAQQKRLIERSRVIFRKDDLTGLLPSGQLQTLALPGIVYTLSLTPGLLSNVFMRQLPDRPLENLLPDPKSVLGGIGNQSAGYVDLDNDGHWWKPQGRVFYHPDRNATAAAELAVARSHFFMPQCFTDPFRNSSIVEYDNYAMFPTAVTDPLGNTSSLVIDYRVLEGKLLTDPNGNRTAVAFDALSMVVGTAMMGKVGENIGDSLDNFNENLTQAETDTFFQDPRGPASISFLGSATTRVIYDVTRYWRDPQLKKPSYAASIARETHTSDLVQTQQLNRQVEFTFSDGFGRVIQRKAQAKPGPVVDNGPVIPIRWVGTGWKIYNNKGKEVKEYEPFFDDTHDFKFDMKVGVSPTFIYDPLERVVAILHPDHTVEKVLFDAWSQKSFDVNDNILLSDPRSDLDVGGNFKMLPVDDFLPSWYDARISGQRGPEEKATAIKSSVHANTPTTSQFDPLGRTILVAHDNGADGLLITRSTIDIEGNQLESIDPRGRVVVRTDFDMSGMSIRSDSMDSAARWTLTDVTGQILQAWNSRGFRHRVMYDALRRPSGSFWMDSIGSEMLVQKTTYGESVIDAPAHNFRGRVVAIQDQAGISSIRDYDFKGNILSSSRQFAIDYKNSLDWSTDIPLLEEIHPSSSTFDALNRPIQIISADRSKTIHSYNETGRLDKVSANIRGEQATDPSTWTPFIRNIEYNAKGQTAQLDYGNSTTCFYTYDPTTFRLQRMLTKRPPGAGPGPLQDINYTYDPVGNIAHIQDNSLQTVYFRNGPVEPSNDYTYDAIYRLIQATGREHLGQTNAPNIPTSSDTGNTGLNSPGDSTAMARYVEAYIYDLAGNITTIKHSGSDATKPGWTRNFSYNEKSMVLPGGPTAINTAGDTSNRLSGTSVGGFTESYRYDIHGNTISISPIPQMNWDFLDQLHSTARQIVNNGGTPETTYYVYDSDGQRVRKVTERQATTGQEPTIMKERLYLGNSQRYREYGGDGLAVTLERETLDVMGEKDRAALVETRTQGGDVNDPARVTRVQLGNLIGSVVLELDDQARIISYEEYLPYGSTSYQAVRSQTETPKRYRYTGKERDEETGLYAHGARYYAPWVCRWISPDPKGIGDGLNVYGYVHGNPIRFNDPTGTEGEPPKATPGPGKKTPDADKTPKKSVGESGNKTQKPPGKPPEKAPDKPPAKPGYYDVQADRIDKYARLVAPAAHAEGGFVTTVMTLQTASAESDFRVLANTSDPESLKMDKDAVLSSSDQSLGMFQQTPMWQKREGTTPRSRQERMDPVTSAKAFVQEMQKTKAFKDLQEKYKDKWDSLEKGEGWTPRFKADVMDAVRKLQRAGKNQRYNEVWRLDAALKVTKAMYAPDKTAPPPTGPVNYGRMFLFDELKATKQLPRAWNPPAPPPAPAPAPAPAPNPKPK